MLEEEGVVLKEEEDIFQDPVFSESTTFRLSTSNIGTGELIIILFFITSFCSNWRFCDNPNREKLDSWVRTSRDGRVRSRIRD